MRIYFSGSTRKWHCRVQKPRDFCVNRGSSSNCGASENKGILPSPFLWGKHNLHFLPCIEDIHKFWTFHHSSMTFLLFMYFKEHLSPSVEVVCGSSLCLYSSEETKSPWLFVHSVSERSYIFICPSLFAPNGVIIPPQVGHGARPCSLGQQRAVIAHLVLHIPPEMVLWNIQKICCLSYVWVFCMLWHTR